MDEQNFAERTIARGRTANAALGCASGEDDSVDRARLRQRDLGPNTAAIARSMTRFDPDPTWTEVKP